MSKKLYEESNLQAIANAIREKNGTQNQYTPSQMPNAILQIHGEPDLETLTVTENGNYLPSANKDGFSEVAVTVPNSYTNSDEGKVVKNGSLISQTPRAAGITENGTYDTTENNSVVVNVPTGSAVVQSLSVTQNGTYNPPSGVDGYAPVTVNVPSGGGSGDEPTVYWGDEEPLSSLGNDGDAYIRGDIYVFRDSNNKFLKAVNKDYVVTSTSQLLSTHSGAFYKTVEGPAIAIECQISNTFQYKGPLLISTVEDYVKYTANTNHWGSVEVDGVVWYISGFQNYNSLEDTPSIPTYYDFATDLGNMPETFDSTYASALVRKFLELAAPSSYGSVYIKSNSAWELMAKEFDFETLTATSNGLYVPSLGKDGFDKVTVSVSSGGGGNLYTNGQMYQEEQITDVTGYTLLYDSSIRFGNTGQKVAARLAITDESAHSALQAGGWSANGMACYDVEGLIGAYGGYNFGEAIIITKARFWLNRYSGQNNTLIVTVEYLDENGNWNEIQDLEITNNMTYPSYVFGVIVGRSVYGIRWIHKKQPSKSSGNNITFAGMSIYRGLGQPINIYMPDSSGIILPPTGYDGFGPLYIQ